MVPAVQSSGPASPISWTDRRRPRASHRNDKAPRGDVRREPQAASDWSIKASS